MRRLTFALAGAAIGLIGLQFSATANITPASQQALQNSPLAAYPGFGHNQAADEARFERESLAREKMTAQCMKQQGFAYTVAPAAHIDTANPQQDVAIAQNPNISYAESLSAARRAEYYMALYGVPNPNSPAADDLYDRNAPGGGGCSGAAFAAIPGVYTAQSELTEQYIELRRSIKQDGRVIAAERNWSACMQSQGFHYGSTQDLLAELDNAVAENRLTPELEQRHAQASDVARSCGAQAGLDNAIAQARIEKETAFVAAHKAKLEGHREQLRKGDTLLNQTLNEGK